MLGNYVATFLGQLRRDGVYVLIAILGLAVAFTAAILIAAFVRNELTYDHWVPNYRSVAKIGAVISRPGQPPDPYDVSPSTLAARLKVEMPNAVVARLKESLPTLSRRAGNEGVAEESFAWVDPEFFSVFPLPALAGDPAVALRQPDALVITRAMARKYFGRDLPIGETLRVEGPQGVHPFRVMAVLKDLPSNTNLVSQIFASSRSPYSDLHALDRAPPGLLTTFTYVRLPPSATWTDLQHALDVTGRPVYALYAEQGTGGRFRFRPLPLAELHLTPPGHTDTVAKPLGSRQVAYSIAGIGALIVLVAAINFVTLLTARAARRGVEVGVRKAVGARRVQLMQQFMAEALIQTGIAALLAEGFAELLLHPFGAFTHRDLGLGLIHDPSMVAAVIAVALVVGLLASIYPALVLSSFRPATVLKGGVVQAIGPKSAREALVAVQFAILIGLIATTVTIYRQTHFALSKGVGDNGQLILRVNGSCKGPFAQEVARLPGVAGAACSTLNALNTPALVNSLPVEVGGGHQESFDWAPVEFGFFQVYGIHPLAGRVFSPDHGTDGVLANWSTPAQPTVVINETAARKLGYSDPRAAVGRQMLWTRPGAKPVTGPSEIIGVVSDMPMTVRDATDPIFYLVVPGAGPSVISIRLTGQDISGTARAIERLWAHVDPVHPMIGTFLSQYRQTLNLDLIIESEAVADCAALAVLLACVGLFALSAYTAERRTKEIGIRKAMGASTLDVVRLLVWQFSIPVICAIGIATPIAVLITDHWLHQFVYRVGLSAWPFVAAPAAALIIAWLTVLFHSYTVGKSNPAAALRYE